MISKTQQMSLKRRITSCSSRLWIVCQMKHDLPSSIRSLMSWGIRTRTRSTSVWFWFTCSWNACRRSKNKFAQFYSNDCRPIDHSLGDLWLISGSWFRTPNMASWRARSFSRMRPRSATYLKIDCVSLHTSRNTNEYFILQMRKEND